MKKFHAALGLGSLLAIAGAISLTPTIASAQPASETYIACNQFDECWRVHDRYTNYPTGVGIIIHQDNWRWGRHDHYRWRHDRDGRGYYRNGAWFNF